MAKALVSDELWAVIAPLLPPHRAGPGKRGRPPISDRKALTGVLFVLKSGIGWEDLPAEMDCGSGMTCWRRLRDWHNSGVWQALHETLLVKLQHVGVIDWSRASMDSISVRAKGATKGGLRARRLARRLWTEPKQARSAIWS